jgi:hypothetical protein
VDVGGPFRTIKNTYKDERGFPFNPTYSINNGLPTASGTWKRWYTGPLYATTVGANGYFPYPPSAESSDSDLVVYGTRAIARCKPTNSLANTAVGLAELYREGIPKFLGVPFWKDKTNIARGAGSEYLNIQFGWLPLISDIKDVAKAIDQADKVWKQYVRDSGRLVRRRYEFPDEITETVTVLSTSAFPSTTPGVSLTGDFFVSALGGTLTRRRTVTKKRWFSGAFVYYVPDDSSGVGSLARNASYARKIYGITLDPEVIWNLAPWSWAVDWFTTIGDVIANVSDLITDGLLMKWGYMMENSIVEDHYTLTHSLKTPGVPNPLTLTLTTEVKKRIKASPYGFGFLYDDLTDRQKAIIAALAVTR